MARLAPYAGLLALLPVAWCRIGYDLRPTQTNFATDQFDFEWGWTPMPTTVPNVLLRGLERRQEIAPNATCGFVDGVSTSALTCINNNLYCGLNSGYGAAGCCSGWTLVNAVYTLTDCDFFTTCYDSTALAAGCDSSCQTNTQDLRCGDSSQPYCITWSFTDIGYTFLGCAAPSGLTEYLAITYNAPSVSTTTTTTTTSSVIIIITTSSKTNAQTSSTLSTTPSTTLSTTVSVSAFVFTTPTTSSNPGTSTSSATLRSSSSTSVLSSSTSVPPSNSGFGTSTMSSTATLVNPVSTNSPLSTDTNSIVSTTPFSTPGQSTTSASSSISSSAGSAGLPGASTASSAVTATEIQTAPASTSSGSSSAQNTTKSSSNTGAIAGGVVGGVAVLALAAFLIWFCLRRRKKNAAAQPPTPEVSHHTSMTYPYSPVSPNTQVPSQYGSPEQVHEFPAVAAAGAYTRSHPMDHPQSGFQPGQYAGGQAHEISSEGTGSSRPLNPNPGYGNAPEVVQGGYRGVDPTGGGYNQNASASYGAEPGFYGRPYSEMP